MYYKYNLKKELKYPLTRKQIKDEEFINIESPTFFGDPRVSILPEDVPTPTYEKDGDAYWLELAEVAMKVNAAKKKQRSFNKSWLPKSMRESNKFISETFEKKVKVRNFYDGAQAVRADWPDYIISQLIITLFEKGATIKCLFEGQENHIRFTNGVVLLSNIINQAIYKVSPNAFAIKWHYGRQRPSEAAGRWARGETEISRGADMVLENLINRKNVIANQNNFSIYTHPGHCSYIAMHGAAAGTAVLLPCLLDNLNEDLINEIKLTTWGLGAFRDFAGVHYRSDTIEGIRLGEKIISENLYQILHDYSEINGLKLKISEEEIKDTTKNLNNDWY